MSLTSVAVADYGWGLIILFNVESSPASAVLSELLVRLVVQRSVLMVQPNVMKCQRIDPVVP